MKLVGNKIGRIKLVVLALACTASSLLGQARLTAASNGPASLQIRLENRMPIAGLQFVLRSSSDIELLEIHRIDRTNTGNWTVAYNRLNDSTLSVVIVSTDLIYLSAGNGMVAEVSMFRRGGPTATSSVVFTGVVAADPEAQLVEMTTNELNLNAHDSSTTISPSDVNLGQNYPNPFNPSTKIGYEIKRSAYVRLGIFDITGREVGTVVDQFQEAGTYSVTWNSINERTSRLSSGTYFARLQVADIVQTRKLTLTK